jgi:hypothetical protein
MAKTRLNGKLSKIKLNEIFNEAKKNVFSNTSKIIIYFFVLTILSLSFIIYFTNKVLDVEKNQTDFVNLGGSTYVITAKQKVDGMACDEAKNAPGIMASGAITADDQNTATFSTMPSAAIPAYNISAGFLSLLDIKYFSSEHLGVLISKIVANRLGISAQVQTPKTLRTNKGQMDIAGIYDFDSSGKSQDLSYAILIQNSKVVQNDQANYIFNSCWIKSKIGFQESAYSGLWKSLKGGENNGNNSVNNSVNNSDFSDPNNSPKVEQLNNSLGESPVLNLSGVSFSGSRAEADNNFGFENSFYNFYKYINILSISFLLFIFLGFLSTFFRRLEYMMVMQLGWQKVDLYKQTFLEDIYLFAACFCALLTACFISARNILSKDIFLVYSFYGKLYILLCLGFYIGQIIYLYWLKENKYYEYFKNR